MAYSRSPSEVSSLQVSTASKHKVSISLETSRGSSNNDYFFFMAL